MSVKRIPDYKSPEYISRKEDFQGCRMFAFTDPNGVYRVFSYNTVIGQYEDGVWFLNARRYSPSTGKHHNYLRRGMPVSYEWIVMCYHQPFNVYSLSTNIQYTKWIVRRIRRIQQYKGLAREIRERKLAYGTGR